MCQLAYVSRALVLRLRSQIIAVQYRYQDGGSCDGVRGSSYVEYILLLTSSQRSLECSGSKVLYGRPIALKMASCVEHSWGAVQP